MDFFGGGQAKPQGPDPIFAGELQHEFFCGCTDQDCFAASC
jgi:hypothetical protein